MAETPSTMLPLDTPLPEFSLTDAVSGRTVTDRDAAGAKGTLVMFICNHCPFVQHVLAELEHVAHESLARGFGVVAINSNDLEAYPQDGPGPMKELAVAHGWKFPYLFDAEQDVARSFSAACTPDLYLFDPNRRLVYRGRLDASRPGSTVPVTGNELRAALDAVVAGGKPSPDQRSSVGCNIKWKAGAQR